MKIRALILAGGEGSRLGVLTVKRAKPAVPFAGKYRIIDFTLSNCVNSKIFDIMILAQYRPHSLVRHIGVGAPWDLNRSFTGGVHIFQPYQMRRESLWFMGTADAVLKNMDFIRRGNPDLILVLSGDHVYQMDYEPLIKFHLENKADLTVCTLRVPQRDAHRFGILSTDDQSLVTGFVEKPHRPSGILASMGIYVFNFSTLENILLEDSIQRESNHDFGRDIIPRMVNEGYRVMAYLYNGYWVDVGTIESYWKTHMELLHDPPPFNLNDRSWIVHTKSEERPPVLILQGATINNSLITDGCVISDSALVENSILSPGVTVERNAVVRESVILNDCLLKEGAIIERAILDKNVIIGVGSRIGEIACAKKAAAITSIGKDAQIPDGIRIGCGATVACEVRQQHFHKKVIGRGRIVEKKSRYSPPSIR